MHDNRYHEKLAHWGRGSTLNEIRSWGYYVASPNSQTRKMGGKIKMTDLAVKRITRSSSLTYCGVNMFWPFLIREKRSDLKRYGAMFTCLVSRAVHVEVTNQIDTDSFIQALRRMVARHGMWKWYSLIMEATFLAHKKNWKRHCQKWTRKKLGIFCKAIVLTGSPVKETHLLLVTWEEAWKRQIHSAWSIFSSLMKTPSRCLNDNVSRRGNSQLPVIDNGMNEWTLNDSCS